MGSFNGTGNVISDCYTSGSIGAGSGNYGGLTGIDQIAGSATVSNCYSTMGVSASFSGQNFGGLFGVDETGTVTNSFSTGAITGTGTNLGGVIGNSGTTTSGVYLDEYTAGTSSCVGAGSSTCTTVNSGNSTPNYFKGNSTNAPLNSWDFVNTWQVNSGDYPTLRGFSSPAPIIPTPTATAAPAHLAGSSPVIVTCSDSKPENAPYLFRVTAERNGATLYFVPVSGANTKHVVSYSQFADADSFSTIFDYADRSGVIPYTVHYLYPGTWYFKVRGQNGCMPGSWSGVFSVKVNGSSLAGIVNTSVLGISTVDSVVGGKCTNYTVKTGDTLWGIAERSLGRGEMYQSVMQVNGLHSTVILAGQNLRVGC